MSEATKEAEVWMVVYPDKSVSPTAVAFSRRECIRQFVEHWFPPGFGFRANDHEADVVWFIFARAGYAVVSRPLAGIKAAQPGGAVRVAGTAAEPPTLQWRAAAGGADVELVDPSGFVVAKVYRRTEFGGGAVFYTASLRSGADMGVLSGFWPDRDGACQAVEEAVGQAAKRAPGGGR